MKRSLVILLCFELLMVPVVHGKVTIARIFSINMVLQRDVKVRVWGWAEKNESVTITFAGKKYSTKTNSQGKWSVSLNPLPAGGPYEMKVKGTNEIILTNILVGEVWLCSGQSNMEMNVGSSMNADAEIPAAGYPDIRLFTVPKKMSPLPEQDMKSGEWTVCSPATVGNFSAVAYFFGRNLYKELHVPVGLIHSSWGGTDIETWISPGAMNTLEDFTKKVHLISSAPWDSLCKEVEKKADENVRSWHANLDKNDPGLKNSWADMNYNDGDWPEMNLPQHLEAFLPGYDGVVWFRKHIFLTEKEAGTGITINLGRVDDSDISYLNGVIVGSKPNSSDVRSYKVDPSVLKSGENIITMRVIDLGGAGGIGGEPGAMSYTSVEGSHSLAGSWKYKPAFKSGPMPWIFLSPNSFPGLLFNGMIHPLLPLAVRGTIWYQGENNASRALQYQTLFPLMINDWRGQFKNPDMPFYFVQLANYMAPQKKPSESAWAELRESQLKTLSLPGTAMAVIIDIGEGDNIHPKNKQDVGYRLSLPALKLIYGKDVEYSGPIFKSFSIQGNKVHIRFDHIGTGLVSNDKYGYLKGFAIAGEDNKYVWAKATIENDGVIVWNDTITSPINVRYAWGDNPDDANLFNKEGLPASPFRTDK